jgi:hypothetical protein
MENPLAKLALDYWYQVLMVVSIFIFALTGAGLLPAFPTIPAALISLGSFFISLGEWINHPLQTRIIPQTTHSPAGIATSHPRNNTPTGITFVLLGFCLAGFGTYKMFS